MNAIKPLDIRQSCFSNNAITSDMFDLLCGEFIGFGISRAVYECKIFDDAVVKIEYGDYFQNIYEFQAWQRVELTDFSKWFAPCIRISPSGKILIQKRTTDLHLYPAKIPAFFTDVRCDNWGKYKNRPVCHDYGLNLLMEVGMTKRMRKANWD